MISRWEDVAARVAIKLQLDEVIVLEWINQMCSATLEHARHPEVMETEFIGLGYLQAKLSRIVPTKKYYQDLIRIKKRYISKYSKDPVKFAKSLAKYQEDVAILERDVAALSRFLDQKREIYDSGGKKLFREQRRAIGKNKKRFRHKKFTLSHPDLFKEYYLQKGRKKKVVSDSQ